MPILAGAAAVAALAWAYLLAAHGGYWRTDQRLPPGAHDAARDPARWPSVVAVVPARDEAAILPVTLPGLLAQDYPGNSRWSWWTTSSTDGTATTAAELAATSARRLLITAAEAPPPGWAGKSTRWPGTARGGDCDYLLFTDADIGYAPDMLAALVRGAVADDRALVADGPAARGVGVGACHRPGLRLLLRPALPVPPGSTGRNTAPRPAAAAWLHAGPPRR